MVNRLKGHRFSNYGNSVARLGASGGSLVSSAWIGRPSLAMRISGKKRPQSKTMSPARCEASSRLELGR
jgi:hypothetical protein